MTRIGSCGSTRPWRWAGVVIRRQRRTMREMLSTADLVKVIELSSETEKQNKIEAIELEAMEALRRSISNGSPELALSLRDRITELSKSGLVSVRSQAQGLLQSLQEKP